MGGYGRPWEAVFTIEYITERGGGHGRTWKAKPIIAKPKAKIFETKPKRLK